MDVALERKLLENLKASGLIHTCILVTHRPASAEFCNRSYEIREGAVTEVTHGA
jgi:ABC-type bacteriocin/lantibiotic exporter with double-glycine peptidase domain